MVLDSNTPVSRMFQSIFLPFLAEIKVICHSISQSPLPNPQSPTIPMFAMFTVRKLTFALWQHIQGCSKSIPDPLRQGVLEIF